MNPNMPLISSIATHLAGQGIGIQAAASFAPGVVGIHDTYRGRGEWDVYFDKARWAFQCPEVWRGSPQIRVPGTIGIGILSGLGTTMTTNSFSALLTYARMNLQPTGEGLAWNAIPQEIPAQVLGAITMTAQEESVPVKWTVVSAGEDRFTAVANMSPGEIRERQRVGPLSGGGGKSANPGDVMNYFWDEAQRIVDAGRYVDLVRPGLMDPNIPVRVIELITGQGLLRYDLQVKVSLFDDGFTGIHVYLYEQRFAHENDEAPDSEEIIYSVRRPLSLENIPYSVMRPGLDRRAFESAPTVEAFRMLASLVTGFERIAAIFIEKTFEGATGGNGTPNNLN